MTRRIRATILGAAVLALTVVIAGCSIRANPLTGDVEVTPQFGEDPSIGGTYQKTRINGQCYLSNGTWCVPCDGGQLLRCSQYIRGTNPVHLASLVTAFADGRIDDVEFIDALLAIEETAEQEEEILEVDLQADLLSLTGGLTGPEFMAASGWLAAVVGSEPINTRARVHYFSDEDGEDALDFTFLWRTDWAPPADIPGVTVWTWITGNLADDDPRDLQIMRVSGTQAGVMAALEGMRREGTPVQVLFENGATFTF